MESIAVANCDSNNSNGDSKSNTDTSNDRERETEKIGMKLAPYNPTDYEVVDTAIKLLGVRANDVVYDLGCGDGRFLEKV